jgi:hypothetical protein
VVTKKCSDFWATNMHYALWAHVWCSLLNYNLPIFVMNCRIQLRTIKGTRHGQLGERQTETSN